MSNTMLSTDQEVLNVSEPAVDCDYNLELICTSNRVMQHLITALQQNLWVASGSGRLPSV